MRVLPGKRRLSLVSRDARTRLIAHRTAVEAQIPTEVAAPKPEPEARAS
jgi:hypothetical protein